MSPLAHYVLAKNKDKLLVCVHCGYDNDGQLYDLLFPMWQMLPGYEPACPGCGKNPFIGEAELQDWSYLSSQL